MRPMDCSTSSTWSRRGSSRAPTWCSSISIRIPRRRSSTDRKRCSFPSSDRFSTTLRSSATPTFAASPAPGPRRRFDSSLTPPVEREIKLRLPRDAVARLLRHPALARHKSGRARRCKLASTYFDTASLRLAKSGVGLRMRRDGRRWIQTVKGPAAAESGGGLAARPEYEWAIDSSAKMPALDVTRLAPTPLARKLLKAVRGGLAPIFATEFTRTEIPLALPGRTTAMLAVDVGMIRAVDSRRRVDLCEAELELKSGSVAPLFRFALALADDLPLSLEPASKAVRGIRLVSSTTPQPVHAENAKLASDATAGDALAS